MWHWHFTIGGQSSWSPKAVQYPESVAAGELQSLCPNWELGSAEFRILSSISWLLALPNSRGGLALVGLRSFPAVNRLCSCLTLWYRWKLSPLRRKSIVSVVKCSHFPDRFPWNVLTVFIRLWRWILL